MGRKMPSVYKVDTDKFEVVFGEGDARCQGGLIIPYESELEDAILAFMKERYKDVMDKETEPEPEWEYKSCHAGCIDSDVCSSSCQLRKYYRRRPGGEWEEY
jgi:hypothetical protein